MIKLTIAFERREHGMWFKGVGLLSLFLVMVFIVRPILLKKLGRYRYFLEQPKIGMVGILVITAMINIPLFGWNLYTIIWLLIINVPIDLIMLLFRKRRNSN